MTAAFIIVAVVVLALIALASPRGIRLRRKPAELRGDWWEQFEREFRVYAGQSPGAPNSAPRQAHRAPRQARDRRSDET